MYIDPQLLHLAHITNGTPFESCPESALNTRPTAGVCIFQLPMFFYGRSAKDHQVKMKNKSHICGTWYVLSPLFASSASMSHSFSLPSGYSPFAAYQMSDDICLIGLLHELLP